MPPTQVMRAEDGGVGVVAGQRRDEREAAGNKIENEGERERVCKWETDRQSVRDGGGVAGVTLNFRF